MTGPNFEGLDTNTLSKIYLILRVSDGNEKIKKSYPNQLI